MSLRSEFRVAMSVTISHKNNGGFSPPVVCRGLVSNLPYLRLCAYSVVQHISCCVFVVFLCPFLIAPSVFSNVYLNSDGIKSINIKQSEQSSLTLIKLTKKKDHDM